MRVQPLLEVPHPNLMLNLRLPNHNRYSRQTSAYIIDPVVLAKGAQALSYRFIERIRRHLDRMLDPFEVAEDTVQVRRPTTTQLPHSSFLRHHHHH